MDKPSRIKAAVMLVALSGWVVFCVSKILLYKVIAKNRVEPVPRQFHRGVCKLMGLEVVQKGELCAEPPMLFVANHVSYKDIFIIGGIVPGYFIAKSEVASWPILGSLSRLQNTLFFERRGPRAREQIGIMREHLEDGGNLMLFPEGTSTLGVKVLPFKSSLFAAAEAEDVRIQPISLAFTHYEGEPMSDYMRDYYGWEIDVPFSTHFLNVLGLGKARVELIYHPPVRVSDFASRKECAAHCHQQVSDGLTSALSNAKPIS